ncbi:MAG: hypothetical protein WCE61_16500 [Candidatus Acidiferrum sp.]
MKTTARVLLGAASALLLVAGSLAGGGGHQATDTAQKTLGVHAYEVDGVEVALSSVERTSGGTITVRWQYRNTTAEPKKLGESFTGMGSSEAYSLEWDAYVVDTGARVKYKVLKDTKGDPVAANHGGRKVVVLPPKGTKTVWAKFLVPVGVKQVTVFLPGVEPFEDVKIAEMKQQ